LRNTIFYDIKLSVYSKEQSVRYVFSTDRVSCIAINDEYVLSETDGAELVVETPGHGWSVRTGIMRWGRTLRIRPPRPPKDSGGGQVVTGNHYIGGPVTQVKNAGTVSIGGDKVQAGGQDLAAKVVIYLPAGYKPDITSL
jgi:hypothetical protein